MYFTMLLALIISIDNIVVGVSYGTRKIRIPLIPNLLIALITGTGTFISLLCGNLCLQVISPQVAKYIGAAMLIIFSLLIIYQEAQRLMVKVPSVAPLESRQNKGFGQQINLILENPVNADFDISGDISFREALLLGSALAVNNFAFGIGAGLIGINPLILTFDTFMVSLITLYIGSKMGKHISENLRLGKWAGLIGGLLLLVTGIYDLFIPS